MASGINPKIDVAFKAIFGADENKDVLLHLLNAVLTPPPEHSISDVVILNPYNDAEFQEGKQSIVDIKAKDQQGRTFQKDKTEAIKMQKEILRDSELTKAKLTLAEAHAAKMRQALIDAGVDPDSIV
jgi:hypothetical protein